MKELPNKKILTYSQKQKILYLDKTPQTRLKEWGSFYLEKDLIYDALEFFLVAKDDESINALKNIAKKEGNFFLFDYIVKQKNLVSNSEYNELGDNAKKNGLYLNALNAYKKANNAREVEAIETLISEPKNPS